MAGVGKPGVRWLAFPRIRVCLVNDLLVGAERPVCADRLETVVSDMLWIDPRYGLKGNESKIGMLIV